MSRVSLRCTAAAKCDAHRDGAASRADKCPYYCDSGDCRRKAVVESRSGKSYCRTHAPGPGRPRTTGGGSNRVEFRVTDAEMADLARNGNPNAEAKRRTFAASATPEIKTVYDIEEPSCES